VVVHALCPVLVHQLRVGRPLVIGHRRNVVLGGEAQAADDIHADHMVWRDLGDLWRHVRA
jgi:hypothetical protein